MAGRPSKPVELLKKEKKSHRTKKELAFRKKQESKLKSGTTFNVSQQVKNDIIAHREFIRLKRLYKNIEFVEGLDEQIINRYCLEISKKYKLEELLLNVFKDIENSELEKRISLYKIVNNLENDINKINSMLIKLEDRLFLNPVARIKSVPKKEKGEPKDNEAYLFGE